MGVNIYSVFNAYSIFHRLTKLELTDLQLDPITFITVSMRDSWIRVAPRFKCFKLEHTLKILKKYIPCTVDMLSQLLFLYALYVNLDFLNHL